MIHEVLQGRSPMRAGSQGLCNGTCGSDTASRGRGARCSHRLRIDPVVSTGAMLLAEADGMLRDALTCVQAVMHARPTRTMIRAHSITVALDPPAAVVHGSGVRAQ